jgi:hypothetical protein
VPINNLKVGDLVKLNHIYLIDQNKSKYYNIGIIFGREDPFISSRYYVLFAQEEKELQIITREYIIDKYLSSFVHVSKYPIHTLEYSEICLFRYAHLIPLKENRRKWLKEPTQKELSLKRFTDIFK